jgi:hypothetical protein
LSIFREGGRERKQEDFELVFSERERNKVAKSDKRFTTTLYFRDRKTCKDP